MSSSVLTFAGSLPSPAAQPPLENVRVSGSASSAAPASSRALSRILPVALAIAAGVPSVGLVLKPWPTPNRSVSAGTTFTSRAGTPSSPATSCAYSGSLPSDSVVRLSTILPVGCTRRKTARYASSATLLLLCLVLLGEALALLVGGQRVVLLEVAERRLRPAERMRRHGRPLAAGIDAELRHEPHPGVVLPRLGPYPLGIATELPGTGVALAQGSGSSTTVGSSTVAVSAP